jgi:anti-sigma regulatory factor (Ser/Thr protein kinase)
VAASRQFVEEAVTDLPDDVRENAILMMSELATNAIVHAATGFEVDIDRTKDWLRFAVIDAGDGNPELRSPSSGDPHGRGLQIVKELADEWGVIDNEDNSGKTVWCAVRLDGTSRSMDATSARVDARGRPDRRRAPAVRPQPDKGSDRSETGEDGRAQSSSNSGGRVRACRVVHRPRSQRMAKLADVRPAMRFAGG